MNGKQRARWYSDLISDAQRLRKMAHGHGDALPLDVVLSKLFDARTLALTEIPDQGSHQTQDDKDDHVP